MRAKANDYFRLNNLLIIFVYSINFKVYKIIKKKHVAQCF